MKQQVASLQISTVNISKRNNARSEEGLNLVATPEKIEKWRVKKDLEKLGREIHLKMHYLNKPKPLISEVPAFKIPSN